MKNYYLNSLMILSFVLLIAFNTNSVQATCQYFDDQVLWETAVSNMEHFDFTPSNMTLADEISSPPSSGDILVGIKTLTFQPANTGLLTDFQIDSPYYDFHYSDYGEEYDGYNYLTFGGPGGSDNDDWKGTFGEGCYAFGFYLLDNLVTSGESLTVYGIDDEELLSVSLPGGTWPGPYTGADFMGVVCDEPIGWVSFDEAADGGDDIGISDFYFGVPEPATLCLFGLGGLLLRRRKHA